MKEHLLYFLFFGIALAVGYNAAVDSVHAHFFPASLVFEQHWLALFVVTPALLLLALGWLLGFFRRNSVRWADGLVILTTAILVYATLGAGYSCWKYCF
jgi:hypothetical protein